MEHLITHRFNQGYILAKYENALALQIRSSIEMTDTFRLAEVALVAGINQFEIDRAMQREQELQRARYRGKDLGFGRSR